LVGRGPYAEQESLTKDKSKYGSLATRDYDFSDCDAPTPSYRAYPFDYPGKKFSMHSGQSEADVAVLNNSLVCAGNARTGSAKQKVMNSEEDYDAIKARRNAYEEALFKVR
jgi:histone deacetylase complex regulatory component SIN3